MQPRLLKTTVAQYQPAVYDGTNQSGYQPIGDKILVLPDQAAEKTSGGVFIDPVSTERLTLAAETAVLVALGEYTFVNFAEGTVPKAGDRVYLERYSGQVMLGDDGQVYRLCDDRCVGAIKARAA